MYDLTVEEVHNFAVGEGDWVVHNCTLDFFEQITINQYGNARPVTNHKTIGGVVLDFKLSPAESAFVTDLLNSHSNLHVYRTPDGQGLGDFFVIDMSNPVQGNRQSWLIEFKAPTGSTSPYLNHNSSQVNNNFFSTVTRLFGIGQVNALEGTPSELMNFFGG